MSLLSLLVVLKDLLPIAVNHLPHFDHAAVSPLRSSAPSPVPRNGVRFFAHAWSLSADRSSLGSSVYVAILILCTEIDRQAHG